MTEISRRGLLTGSSAALAGGAVAAGLALASTHRPSSSTSVTSPESSPSDEVVPFHGVHQAGIATRPQAFGAFLGLDLARGTSRADVVRLMRVLTDDARRLTQGRPALGDTEPELATRPARLTITVGFGPGFFDATGTAAQRPASVRELPAFSGDKLQPRWGQSDLVTQICTDDPTTLAHTVRMLSLIHI